MTPPGGVLKTSSKVAERPQKSDSGAPAPFVPSAEWQVVPPGTPIPPGAEIRMALDGEGPGGVLARWPAAAPPGAASAVGDDPAPDGGGDGAADPFAGRAAGDPARLAYRAARRAGFPFLRLRRGRSFGDGEGAWWRDIGRAEGERDVESLYRVVRHFELGDEDGPAPSGRSPAADAGREETDR
jgi:hypothetical protein